MLHYLIYDDVQMIILSDIIANDRKDLPSTKEDFRMVKLDIDRIFFEATLPTNFIGATYLKKAIYIAFRNQDLLNDNKQLIKIVSRLLKVQPSAVRGAIDYYIDYINNFLDMDCLFNVLGPITDNRNLSTKYMIDLCVNYLNRKYYFSTYNL